MEPEEFSDLDWLELQADQYARKAVRPGEKDRDQSLLTRAQVRALIRDAYIEGRLSRAQVRALISDAYIEGRI